MLQDFISCCWAFLSLNFMKRRRFFVFAKLPKMLISNFNFLRFFQKWWTEYSCIDAGFHSANSVTSTEVCKIDQIDATKDNTFPYNIATRASSYSTRCWCSFFSCKNEFERSIMSKKCNKTTKQIRERSVCLDGVTQRLYKLWALCFRSFAGSFCDFCWKKSTARQRFSSVSWHYSLFGEVCDGLCSLLQ